MQENIEKNYYRKKIDEKLVAKKKKKLKILY